MNKHELDRVLKSAKIPERPGEYWRDFPGNVTARLRRGREFADRRDETLASRFNPWLFRISGAALAGAVAALFFIHFTAHPTSESDQLVEARKCYQELEGLFPHQLEAIVFDRQGPRMVLAEKASVPDSTPLYVKLCGPKGCQGFVTFSGQKIQFNGESCEVLADERGRVMVVGSHQVWSADAPAGAVRLVSQPLEATL